MKVVLVCPTNNYHGRGTIGVFYPMGILMVGTRVRRERADCEVQVIDGELASTEEIVEAFEGAEVVGLSANTMNYPACLELVRAARARGVKRIVIGGPHASALPEQILAHQADIDAAFVYDGDDAFLQYLTDEPRNVPNLVWRAPDGTVVVNSREAPTRAPRLVDMDYDLIRLERYWKGHALAFPSMGAKFVEGFTHIGCAWRVKLGCTYCDIPYPNNTYQDPDVFWSDVRVLRESLGITSMKDYGDCFSGDEDQVRRMLEQRPAALDDFELAVYARSSEISETMADLFAALNVRYCYLGFDSGDTGMLRSMQKGYSARANMIAIERLAKRKIRMNGNVILGAKGESERSIENTTRFVAEALTEACVHQLLASTLAVFPGAPLYADLQKARADLVETDLPDHTTLQRVWAETFCEVGLDRLVSATKAINQMNRDLSTVKQAVEAAERAAAP